MIDQNTKDKESFTRETTVETMKENEYLKHGDTVLVALGDGGYSFYKITNDPNVVELNNGLFAVREKDKHRYTKEEVDEFVKKLDEKITQTQEDNAHDQINQAIQNLGIQLTTKAEKVHNHRKDEITDFPSTIPNPFTLTITNGRNQVIYDGTESKSIEIRTDGSIPGDHRHKYTDLDLDSDHRFVTDRNIETWNSKAAGNHTHAQYAEINNVNSALNGKADKVHNHTDYATASSVSHSLDQKANKTHSHPSLRIINGAQDITYTGLESKTITIDASGSAPAKHNHGPNDINVDSSHRFVTDAQISTWNGKANGDHTHSQYATTSDLSRKADASHSHSEYQPKGSYASAAHTHDQYASTYHNHNASYLALSGGTLSGNLTVNGDIRANKVYNAVWNDYAEFFERGEETEPGDLISLDCSSDKEQYAKASLENPVLVGVHSDSFANLIGGKDASFEENLKEFIPVGLAGRVKCKVIGKVLKGQYIGLSNLPGIGTTVDYLNPYIVGIALEDKLTEGLGIVKILIK